MLSQFIVCYSVLLQDPANINTFFFFRLNSFFCVCSKACPLNCKQSAVFCIIKHVNKTSLSGVLTEVIWHCLFLSYAMLKRQTWIIFAKITEHIWHFCIIWLIWLCFNTFIRHFEPVIDVQYSNSYQLIELNRKITYSFHLKSRFVDL